MLLCFLTHLSIPLGLAVGDSASLPAAGRLAVRARGGEPRRAARHEPQGRAGQALAAPAALAVLPLPAARRLHHHVPLLLPGTARGRVETNKGWRGHSAGH